MSIIDSIQLSGSSYDVRDKSATTVVSLTQQEYDALPSSAKTANILYNITDATAGDLTQYWTSAQTQSAITEAVSGKQDTLVSGTNIKTINNESILGSGNITIQGGGTDTGTVQTMIDQSISGKADSSTVTALTNTVTGHTADTSIHVTTAQTAAWNAKSDFSGSYNDLTNKLSAGTNITIVDNVISAEGGGKAIEAGRGISVTTGETADTVSFNLPISAGTSQDSIIIGDARNISSGIVSVAEGFQTSAMTNYAHSEGSRTLASGSYSSHAEGSQTSATSEASHSEGYQTTASGKYSHSEGWGTLASGQDSHSEGKQTSATTSNAHAEGSYTTASGASSHAEGEYSKANGRSSHAEGSQTVASGRTSHAEGGYTKANGNTSHAEGYYSTASGAYSHAEGNTTQASGDISHAEGYVTSAMTEYSHAEGYGTITKNSSEHASGQFNNSVSASTTFGDSGNTLFSIGNGTADDARHNAFEIRQNGDIYLSSGGTDIKLQDYLGGGGSITVDSALDSGSTNPVENQALWDELRLGGAGLVETTIEWSGNYSTNYPTGSTEIKLEFTSTGNTSIDFENETSGILGNVSIQYYPQWSTVSVDNTRFEGSSYEISGSTITISYPSVTNVTSLHSIDIYTIATVTAIYNDPLIVLKDQVTANTAAIEAKVDTTTFNSYASSVDSALGGKLNISDYVVDSALNVASTNPVQNQALYSELRIDNESGETETTLVFDGVRTTNYPQGCTKIKVEDITSYSSNNINFIADDGSILGYVAVSNWGSISVDTSNFQGASYEISGSSVIISYPTVTTVTRLDVSDSTKYTYKAITSSTTPLKDQVVANTTALGGLKLVKLTESAYQALSVKDPDTLYVVIPDPS